MHLKPKREHPINHEQIGALGMYMYVCEGQSEHLIHR